MVETHDGPVRVVPTATEQTPLLEDRPKDVENDIPSSNAEAVSGSAAIIEEEPTNRELALTMSCIWVCLPPPPFPRTF
jgi:hypothetical protein